MRAKIILTVIFLITATTVMMGIRGGRTYYLMYKVGIAGACTSLTVTPYTTNIGDAINGTPITQNSLYTTSVFSTCPYTVIFPADAIALTTK
jgi:hypothetical protein